MQVFDHREADPAVKGDVECGRRERDEPQGDGDRAEPAAVPAALRRLPGVSQTLLQSYGMGGTRATTEIPFDELILRMMRAAGALA